MDWLSALCYTGIGQIWLTGGQRAQASHENDSIGSSMSPNASMALRGCSIQKVMIVDSIKRAKCISCSEIRLVLTTDQKSYDAQREIQN
jgi:hypothetical protein